MFKHIKSNYSQEEFRKFINHKGHNGMSALHHAGVHGHSPVLNVLLRNYADVTSVDNRNRTIFHAVSYSGCIVCFDYVTDYLKKAVEVQQKKEKKMTKKTKNTKQNTAEIVEYSYSSSSSEDEGLELAQETKVLNWINMTDTNSISPVHMAAWTASKRALQWLLNKKANPNGPPDSRHRTPLHYAALKDKSGDCVSTLIDHDATLLAKDDNNYNPLHWAARSGMSHNIEFLIQKSSDIIYAPDGEGISSSKKMTPLHLAARYGHYKTLGFWVGGKNFEKFLKNF